MDTGGLRDPRRFAAEGEGVADLTSRGRVGVVDVLAFSSELAVFALLAATGWSFADALWLRLTLAFLMPVAVMSIWGRWLAPRSRLRVPQPARVIVQFGIFAASGLLAVMAGLAPWGWILPSAAGLVFGVGALLERRSGRSAAERT
jgi:hypothetical protein